MKYVLQTISLALVIMLAMAMTSLAAKPMPPIETSTPVFGTAVSTNVWGTAVPPTNTPSFATQEVLPQ